MRTLRWSTVLLVVVLLFGFLPSAVAAKPEPTGEIVLTDSWHNPYTVPDDNDSTCYVDVTVDVSGDGSYLHHTLAATGQDASTATNAELVKVRGDQTVFIGLHFANQAYKTIDLDYTATLSTDRTGTNVLDTYVLPAELSTVTCDIPGPPQPPFPVLSGDSHWEKGWKVWTAIANAGGYGPGLTGEFLVGSEILAPTSIDYYPYPPDWDETMVQLEGIPRKTNTVTFRITSPVPDGAPTTIDITR